VVVVVGGHINREAENIILNRINSIQKSIIRIKLILPAEVFCGKLFSGMI